MDLDIEQLAALVLRLPPEGRAEVAARLLASLDDDEAERAAYESAWAAELDRRDAEADADPDGALGMEQLLIELQAGVERRPERPK